MKYCTVYDKLMTTNELEQVDEVIMQLQPGYFSQDDLAKIKNKKIHFWLKLSDTIEDDENIRFFELLKQQYPDLEFDICVGVNDLEKIKAKLQIRKLSYGFSEPISTWDQIDYAIKVGVTHIIIIEELGFNIVDAAAALHAASIEVCAIPNVAQSSVKAAPALTKFFIRPNDVDIYSPYIDTFVFFESEYKRALTYINIYKSQQWFGSLNEIIKGLGTESVIDNRSTISDFGENRLNCKKRCNKGSRCSLCYIYAKISKRLIDNNIILKKK